jgi:hypothetical protein
MYTLLLGILTGGIAAFAMGSSPSWARVLLASVLGFAVGATIDIGMTVLVGSAMVTRAAVALPVYGPYGFTEGGLIAIPFSLIGAAGAALRNYNRIRSPNDLRA